MKNFDPFDPPKPSIERKTSEGSISKTVFSMVLFALTFSLIISDYLLIFFLVLVLLIHELGHFVFMKLYDYKGLKMLFIPFMGALVQGEKKKYSQQESAIMLIAGPLPGIIIGFFLLQYGINENILWLIQLGILFMALNVVNLIPIDPLDGGQLMRVLFFGNQAFFQFVFSFLSSLFLIGIGVWLDAWLLIIFGFLLGFRVKKMFKIYQIRKEISAESIECESTYEKLTDKAFAKIKSIILKYTPILKRIKEDSSEDKFDQIIAHQVDGVLIPPLIKDASRLFKLSVLILWIGAIFLSVYTIFTLDFNDLIYAFQNR